MHGGSIMKEWKRVRVSERVRESAHQWDSASHCVHVRAYVCICICVCVYMCNGMCVMYAWCVLCTHMLGEHCVYLGLYVWLYVSLRVDYYFTPFICECSPFAKWSTVGHRWIVYCFLHRNTCKLRVTCYSNWAHCHLHAYRKRYKQALPDIPDCQHQYL